MSKEVKEKRHYTKRNKLPKSQMIQKEISALESQIHEEEVKLANMKIQLDSLRTNKRDAEKEELIQLIDSKGMDITNITIKP